MKREHMSPTNTSSTVAASPSIVAAYNTLSLLAPHPWYVEEDERGRDEKGRGEAVGKERVSGRVLRQPHGSQTWTEMKHEKRLARRAGRSARTIAPELAPSARSAAQMPEARPFVPREPSGRGALCAVQA